jgi:hypothetical protein
MELKVNSYSKKKKAKDENFQVLQEEERGRVKQNDFEINQLRLLP